MQANAIDHTAEATPIPVGGAAELAFDLSVPLVIDLDHTLLSTDTLHEALVRFLRRKGAHAWRIPGWLVAGKATVKRQLSAALTEEDVAHFPVVPDLVEFAEREAARGRPVILATAADRAVAEKVAARFPFITDVFASDGQANLKGPAKAEKLTEHFPNGFIYAGDAPADLHIWSRALGAIVVGGSPRLENRVRGTTDILTSFRRDGSRLREAVRSLRLHQWAKNALVFVPVILGGKFFDPAAWGAALLGFIAIGLLASATYVLNDLWDIQEDRQHWSKKNRPLASGRLSIASGIGLVAIAGLLALALAIILGPGALETLTLYLLVSLSYSFRFKREPIIDVLFLATLFSIRLALGMVVTGAIFSPWLIIFSMFVFLSLSLAKRQTEIIRMIEHGRERTLGRGYRAGDAPLVLALGVGTMMATVLIMVLYLIEDAFPTGLYTRPDFLWGFPVVIFLFLARIWLLCHRGELDDDPVAFAIRDRMSIAYGGIMVALFLAAIV